MSSPILTPDNILKTHLRGKGNPRTTAAYARDLENIRLFANAAYGQDIADLSEAAAWLLGLNRAEVVLLVKNLIAQMGEDGKALNSIRRHVGSLMGFFKLAHCTGAVAWHIPMSEFGLPAGEAVIDVRGPDRWVVDQIIRECRQRGDAKGVRDEAMVRMLCFCGLRFHEVATLDLQHLNIDAGEVRILGKGLFARRVWTPITKATARALAQWIDQRGDQPGPVFTALDRARRFRDHRITHKSVNQWLKIMAKRIGFDGRITPHSLRHTGATHLLELSGGNIPLAMALTRHRDPKTLMIYNDRRTLLARSAAELLERAQYFDAASIENSQSL